MSAEFERQKNARALLITGLISASLLLLVWMVKWSIPTKTVPEVADLVEIILPDEPPVTDLNLGNNDVGSGNVQPIVTGTPSASPVSQELAPSRGANVQQATRDVDDNDDRGPVIAKPNTTNTAKEINNNTTDQTVKATQPKPKPGAQMTSVRGSGNGGNTDLPGYNRPGSQGPGDGPGDKGVQNGDPNGTKYLGVRVVSIPAQNFEDDFKESGKIALDIAVNSSGKLESATYQVKGSTLARSSKQYSIALQRAREIKYPQYDGGFRQTLTFNFTVK